MTKTDPKKQKKVFEEKFEEIATNFRDTKISKDEFKKEVGGLMADFYLELTGIQALESRSIAWAVGRTLHTQLNSGDLDSILDREEKEKLQKIFRGKPNSFRATLLGVNELYEDHPLEFLVEFLKIAKNKDQKIDVDQIVIDMTDVAPSIKLDAKYIGKMISDIQKNTNVYLNTKEQMARWFSDSKYEREHIIRLSKNNSRYVLGDDIDLEDLEKRLKPAREEFGKIFESIDKISSRIEHDGSNWRGANWKAACKTFAASLISSLCAVLIVASQVGLFYLSGGTSSVALHVIQSVVGVGLSTNLYFELGGYGSEKDLTTKDVSAHLNDIKDKVSVLQKIIDGEDLPSIDEVPEGTNKAKEVKEQSLVVSKEPSRS